MTGAALIRSDAVALPLRDESVDLIITSPPYFALRSYQDDGEHYDGQIGSEPTPADFLAALWAVTDECYRVLKPTGSLWVNLGDKYAGSGAPGTTSGLDRKTSTVKTGTSRYVNTVLDVPVKSLMGLPWRYALGLITPDYRRPHDTHAPHWTPQWTLRAEVIWSKPNGLPESVTDRVRRSHEQWFHLTKRGRYYAAVDEVREKHREPHRISADIEGGGNRRGGVANNGFGLEGERDREYNPLGKLPGSVWAIPSEPLTVPPDLGVDHFAAFPTEWPRRIVLGWSPSGICTACGEGRVPVTESDLVVHRQRNSTGRPHRLDASDVDRSNTSERPTGRTEATITGYRCQCDAPIAPTRPAIVLDPFAGTGTVPLVARTLGRYGIGIDLSRDYLKLATWRVFRSGHGRKADARTNRERQGVLW